MTDVLDQLSTHLEVVRHVLQPLYEKSSRIAGLIKSKGETTTISRYLYRIPIEKYPGGAFSKYSADGGGLGKGHSLSTTHLTAGYFYSNLAFRLTQEQVETTSGGNQSIIDLMNTELARGIETYQIHDDITLHTDGTGQLTNESSDTTAAANSTMTFAGLTDTLGVNRLRPGMTVEVWDATGATKRTTVSGEVPIIIGINTSSKVVTLNENVSGLVDTDILAFVGMDAYGPSPLTSFSSSWPTAPSSQVAAGLGGDSFRHGIYYVNDNTASNYYLGVQKSDVPELLPAYVSGNSAALDYSMAHKIFTQLQQRRDGDSINTKSGLMGIMHMKQREQLFNIGVSIVSRDVNGSEFGTMPDLLPSNHNYMDTVDFGGIMMYISKRQYEDRVDFVNFDNWGRAQVKDIDYFTRLDGSKFFEGRNSSGGVTAEYSWFLTCAMDWYCVDPGSQGYIDSLAVPA